MVLRFFTLASLQMPRTISIGFLTLGPYRWSENGRSHIGVLLTVDRQSLQEERYRISKLKTVECSALYLKPVKNPLVSRSNNNRFWPMGKGFNLADYNLWYIGGTLSGSQNLRVTSNFSSAEKFFRLGSLLKFEKETSVACFFYQLKIWYSEHEIIPKLANRWKIEQQKLGQVRI